jgi:hypothetical protein
MWVLGVGVFLGMGSFSYANKSMAETWMFKLVTLHKLTQPHQEGLLQQIVEFAHLSTLVASYNHHFAMYSTGKKHGTQLIPNVVWKFVY